jgi:MarR family transcriptional regulator, organic hydroperoxide resistance regulator
MPKKDNSPFSVEKADDSTGFLLWQVTNLWQREIKKALTEFDLTHTQFVLMASIHWLALQGDDVTQVLLSSHTKIDPMTISTVLRTLQQNGLVQRKEHPTDTRAKNVVLTEKGKSVTKKAVVIVEAFDTSFFSALGTKTGDFNRKLSALLSENRE